MTLVQPSTEVLWLVCSPSPNIQIDLGFWLFMSAFLTILKVYLTFTISYRTNCCLLRLLLSIHVTFKKPIWCISGFLHFAILRPSLIIYWELGQKIVTWLYLTLYCIAHFTSTRSLLCWWGCGQVGKLLHILWTSKNLQSFWRSVFQLLSSVTGIYTDPEPALKILNLKIDGFPIAFQK